MASTMRCALSPPRAAAASMGRMLAGHPASARRLRAAALPHWLAMRAVLLILGLLAAGAVLVPVSAADSPARARAEASIVTGSLGDFGTLIANGDAERSDDEITVEDEGMVVGAAEAVARASRAGGQGSARAAALARRIDLFDGLVTATLARRTATATAAGVVYAGRIVNLKVEGRQIG